MPLSYTEGYKLLKNQLFRVKPAMVFPYSPQIFMKNGEKWEDVPNTSAFYLDVLYNGKPCDELGNLIEETNQILKAIFWALKFIGGLALLAAIVYLVWKNFLI